MERMESLGEILRRLQQRNTFENMGYPAPADLTEIDSTGTPCPKCGGRGWVRHESPVGHPEFGRAFVCDCQWESSAEDRSARLRRFSNMGMLSNVRFATTDPDGRGTTAEARERFRVAFAAASAYAQGPHGWLVLTGGTGTGKTHLAAAVANQCLEQAMPTFFALVPDLLDHLRATFSPNSELSYDALFEQVKEVPLLVLDDLGAQSSTAWAQEKLFQVINHRYVNSLATVVTTNLPLDQLDGRWESRLADPRHAQVLDLGVTGKTSGSRIGTVEPEMLAQMTFETLVPGGKATDRSGKETLAAALTAAESFAGDPQGWLVLAGDPGCGKTHLAVAVAGRRLKAGKPVFFTFVPDLLDYLRYTFSPESRVTYDERFEQVKQAPLLVLDDLGAESSTAWANEKLYQIIVHRYNARLATIITTRRVPDNPKDPVASRLRDSRLVTVVPITAPDYRQQSRRTAAAGQSRGAGFPAQGR